MSNMSWNPVLNKVIEIKNEYRRRIKYPAYEYVTGYKNR